MKQITVIVCTYNRCRGLPNTLESIASSILPAGIEWEVLVVDNNSSDQTHQVVDELSHRYPGRFRYLFEPRQGKSYALNAGVRAARGKICAFTDDDVLVEPTWLYHLTSMLHSGEWAGAGGRTLPAREFVCPEWMSVTRPPALGGPLCGTFDIGDIPGALPCPPYGANMAFRKDMFEKYGGFRLDVGPPPKKVQGEDTEFGFRLMLAGQLLFYEPSAIVRHPVLEERLSKKYFLKWMFTHGRAVVRLESERSPVQAIAPTHRRVANRVGHLSHLVVMRWMKTTDSKWRFWYKCAVWKTCGELVELFSRLRTVSGSDQTEQVSEGITKATNPVRGEL
jgi:glycosyltransferase involved in cell wall biosynthesis